MEYAKSERSIPAWLGLAGLSVVALGAGAVLPVPAFLGLVALVFLGVVALLALSVQLEAGFLGLTLLVVMGVALPIEFRGPAGVMMSSSLPLSALICGIWFLRAAISRSDRFDGSRPVYAAVAFIGATLLSFAMGQYPWFSSGGAPLPAQVAELGIFLVSVCLFLAAGHQLSSVGQLQVLTALFLASGLVTCLFQMQLHPSLSVVARYTTRPGSVGSLFWTWFVALSFAQALFNRSLPWIVRLLLLGMTGLAMYHGLVNVRSWASGWAPALVALGVIFFVKFPRLSVSLAVIGIPVGLMVATQLSDSLMGDEAYSLMTREEAWRVLWALVERSPVLGTGLANYYYFTENFPILGWYVRFISHNNYQDLLVQTGALGLAAFGWFAVEVFRMIVRVYRAVPENFSRAYVVGALGGLAGSLAAGMLGDWIVPFYYNAGILGFRSSLLFWVFLGGVLALKRIYERPDEAGARVALIR